jgi:predicted permease
MSALLDIILPIFLVVGYGYFARWRGFIDDNTVSAVMNFAQNFAVPLLLFKGIATLDLGDKFQAPLLISFYTGAFAGGLFAFLGARYLFKRPLTDSVAIGFIGLFSNSLLLGVPLSERAYGVDALSWNFAIISIHSPMLFAIGITMMEIAKARGENISKSAVLHKIIRAIAHNPLILGITAGLIVNVMSIPLPSSIWSAVELMSKAAIPAALFGLGGVLVRYKPEGDMRMIAFAVTASLMVHPIVTYVMSTQVFELETGALRAATLTAAVAPGVNAYLFANMYGVAKRVAASSVLIGTALNVITGWLWLGILP